jgi:hypothetical protein
MRNGERVGEGGKGADLADGTIRVQDRWWDGARHVGRAAGGDGKNIRSEIRTISFFFFT